MKYGFVKVCAATTPIKVADVNYNVKKICSAIDEAEKSGAQLVVFPELCVSGYTCGDLFNQQKLLSEALSAINSISAFTIGKKSLVFIGAPVSKLGRLYNCAVAISDGKILAVIPKTNLPNYGEFYEKRHFTSAQNTVEEITICGQKVPFGTDVILKAKNFPQFTVACEICEDLWVPDSPSIRHAMAGANIIVNLSCSNEAVSKAEYRKELVKMQSAKLISGYVYADAGDGESSTDMVFAGHNIIAENGSILAETELFKNALLYSEIDVEKLDNERRRTSDTFFSEDMVKGYKVLEFETDNSGEDVSRVFPTEPFVPASGELLRERTKNILLMQSKGLEQRLRHTNSKTAVIGISGGLDSALALLVTRRAFINIGKDLKDIVAVTMPGFGTTNRTYENSLKLIDLVGATKKIIPIGDTVKQHFKDIGHDISVRDVTYENAQARVRTLILMDLANEYGGLVVGTGDLSELALGWATYNGDHMSMYGVNCSVPKTLVKHLVRYEAGEIGGECGEVLKDILATEISPELLPPDDSGKIAQKTEDLVGPYVLHDFFLYYCLRWGFAPEKIQFIANKTFKDIYDEGTISFWLKKFYFRFFSQQFKRSCIPDGVKVGSVTLSPRGDWRMPSDASPSIWINSIK